MSPTRLAVVLAGVVLIAAARPAAALAQTPLHKALELYASAAYEDALTALDAVAGTDLDVDARVLVAQHQMLCLVAMGRTAAAERAASTLLALRPDFTLAPHDASPRVRTLFDEMRRRILPGVARDLFVAARQLYDAAAMPEARAAFARLVRVLDDDTLIASDPTLADVRTLADGFLTLAAAVVPGHSADPPAPAPASAAAPTDATVETVAAAAALAPPLATEAERTAAGSATRAPVTHIVDDDASLVSFPTDSAVAWRDRGDTAEVPPPSERAPSMAEVSPSPIAAVPVTLTPALPPTATAEAPASATSEGASAPAIAAPADAPAAGAPFTPMDIFTFDWRDKDVTPPVPTAQAVSGWWGGMGEPPAGTPLGAVDLVIDEHGRVVDARIYQSVNRVYDAVLLESVKQWRYEPATRGGRPVKYRRVSGVVSGR